MFADQQTTSKSHTIHFFGVTRELPVTLLTPRIGIANFNILGDVEVARIASVELERKLKEKGIVPDYFVGPEVKVVPLIHALAERFSHKRYVVLRKNVLGYMRAPIVQQPWEGAPKHASKLVLNGADADLLKGKKVVVIDDVVSTGASIKIATYLMKKIGADVLGQCAIFKQGDRYRGDLIFLSELPIIEI